MRRAVLLYNPSSGRNPSDRLRTIERIAAALRSKSIDIDTMPTEGPNTAGQQAAESCKSNPDILFACGGDGTVHEVIQGMAFHPHTALGIIPLGSANVLARHLQLPLDPVRAALQQLTYSPQSVPLGKVTYTTPTGEASRYFLTMAGAGPDGALVYKMLGTGKHRLGRILYYLRSAILFITTHFSAFTFVAGERTTRSISVMAVRVADLGGLFSPLIRGASIDDEHLLVTSLRSPAHLSLLSWFGLSWARLHRLNPYAQTHRVDTFTCSAGETSPVQVQADGEWLGRTPMTVTLVPNALFLLTPNSKTAQTAP